MRHYRLLANGSLTVCVVSIKRMSIIFENQNYRFYLEIRDELNNLMEELRQIVGDEEKELSADEDYAFEKICDKIDGLSIQKSNYLKLYLEDMDRMMEQLVTKVA